MDIVVSFLEGIITFISPCLLPMLPIYLAYFAGNSSEEKRIKTLINAFAFVLGFTILFILLGVFASTLGNLLKQYQMQVNLITGGVVVLFGLHYMGILNISFLNTTKKIKTEIKSLGFFSAMFFGFVFAIGWTPCVGPFLGSALMLAATRETISEGILLLLSYSAGLGIPFLLSAALVNYLKEAFNIIKRNYLWINRICGFFLILVGIFMMTGLFGTFLSIFSI